MTVSTVEPRAREPSPTMPTRRACQSQKVVVAEERLQDHVVESEGERRADDDETFLRALEREVVSQPKATGTIAMLTNAIASPTTCRRRMRSNPRIAARISAIAGASATTSAAIPDVVCVPDVQEQGVPDDDEQSRREHPDGIPRVSPGRPRAARHVREARRRDCIARSAMSEAATSSSRSALITENDPAQMTTTTSSSERCARVLTSRDNARRGGIVTYVNATPDAILPSEPARSGGRRAPPLFVSASLASP